MRFLIGLALAAVVAVSVIHVVTSASTMQASVQQTYTPPSPASQPAPVVTPVPASSHRAVRVPHPPVYMIFRAGHLVFRGARYSRNRN